MNRSRVEYIVNTIGINVVYDGNTEKNTKGYFLPYFLPLGAFFMDVKAFR